MFTKNKLTFSLHRDAIEVAETKSSATRLKSNIYKHVLENSLSLDDISSLQSGLEKVIEQLPKRFYRNYTEVEIILPDPFVRSHVFELSEKPKTKKDLNGLLEWKMSKLFHFNGEDYVTTFHEFGKRGDQYCIYTECVRRSITETIQTIFKKHRFVIKRIDAAFIFLYEKVTEELSKFGHAILFLEYDFWTVLILDEKYRLKFQHSNWIPNDQAHSELLKNIFIETERTIRAYSQSEGGGSVSKILIEGNEELVEPVWKHFNLHVNEEVLVPLRRLNDDAKRSNSQELELANMVTNQ
jgi:hypothetical protein